MPYTKEELVNHQYFQELERADEVKYLQMIKNRTESGDITDGVLRDNSGKIILFEKIIPGRGSNGTSHKVGDLHTIEYEDGYFDYEDDEEELNKIIDREFTEF